MSKPWPDCAPPAAIEAAIRLRYLAAEKLGVPADQVDVLIREDHGTKQVQPVVVNIEADVREDLKWLLAAPHNGWGSGEWFNMLPR